MTKEEVIKMIDSGKISVEGAIFEILCLILDKFEEILKFKKDKEDKAKESNDLFNINK